MKLYKKYPFTPSKLKNKYISTLKYCEYMCPGFAWSECLNYLLECNVKLYVLVLYVNYLLECNAKLYVLVLYVNYLLECNAKLYVLVLYGK
jgi:hypothetical protein